MEKPLNFTEPETMPLNLDSLTSEQRAANAKYWREFRGEDKFIWKIGNFVGLIKKPVRKVTGLIRSQSQIFMRGFRNRF